jgi:hypothetical protein
MDVSAIGIRKLHDEAGLREAIAALDARPALAERSHYFVLEQFVAGDVFHVDALTAAGSVRFAGVSRYGRPPMEVAHQGGVFVTATLPSSSDVCGALTAFNEQLLSALEFRDGATHAEFIRAEADGRLYFLEVAARVGGAFIADTLEAATGINLWREWARIELSHGRAAYAVPAARPWCGGIALALARQEWPDTSAYDDGEIVSRVAKRHHVGLIVASPSHERIAALLDAYVTRFQEDFLAVLPPRQRPD